MCKEERDTGDRMTEESTPAESRGSGRGDRTDEEDAWYENRRGDVLVTALALSTGVAVALSMGWAGTLVIVPPLRVVVPVDIYLYGFLGAITRAIATFVTDLEQVPGAGTSPEGGPAEDPTSGGDGPPPGTTVSSEGTRDNGALVGGVSSKEVKRMSLRVFAALCLAVGLFLTSDLVVRTLEGIERPAGPLMAGLAFVTGFYVDEAYVVLGSLADRAMKPLSEVVTEPSGPPPLGNPLSTSTDEDIGEHPWFRSVRGWILVGIGVALTTVAVLLSIEWGGPDVPRPSFLPLPPEVFPTNRVPFDIYLYAFLGSMGYVFTSLFGDYDRTLQSFLQHVLRAPIGPLLAAALFLLSALVLGITSTRVAQFHAGVAFLVGLYTNVALLTFDAIAAYLFGAIGGGEETRGEEPPQDGPSR